MFVVFNETVRNAAAFAPILIGGLPSDSLPFIDGAVQVQPVADCLSGWRSEMFPPLNCPAGRFKIFPIL